MRRAILCDARETPKEPEDVSATPAPSRIKRRLRVPTPRRRLWISPVRRRRDLRAAANMARSTRRAHVREWVKCGTLAPIPARGAQFGRAITGEDNFRGDHDRPTRSGEGLAMRSQSRRTGSFARLRALRQRGKAARCPTRRPESPKRCQRLDAARSYPSAVWSTRPALRPPRHDSRRRASRRGRARRFLKVPDQPRNSGVLRLHAPCNMRECWGLAIYLRVLAGAGCGRR